MGYELTLKCIFTNRILCSVRHIYQLGAVHIHKCGGATERQQPNSPQPIKGHLLIHPSEDPNPLCQRLMYVQEAFAPFLEKWG